MHVREPGFELIVCGSPNREWLEWVRTTTVPLAGDQVMWRTIAQERVDKLGLRGETRAPTEAEAGPVPGQPDPEVAAVVHAAMLGLPEDPPPRPLLGRRASTTRSCPHLDICDQCGRCERCNCYDCPL